MFQSRVLTIQDISCFGKCSLTVALPIISSMGVETTILPTAVLSTHTGGFMGFTFRDLTSDIKPITEHWKKENIGFNGIYTGYLGSFEQLNLVSEIFDDFGKDAIKLVDPVMGDAGKLYTGFDEKFAKGMAKLCSKADIIVPNITEACYMLGFDYKPEWTEDEYKAVLKKLTALGPKTAVLTGVIKKIENTCGMQGVLAYNAEKDEYTEYYSANLPVKFHGTGDIWASTFCGALCLGMSLKKSLKIAVDYTVSCICQSIDDDEHKYGVRFEECIPYLCKLLNDEK